MKKAIYLVPVVAAVACLVWYMLWGRRDPFETLLCERVNAIKHACDNGDLDAFRSMVTSRKYAEMHNYWAMDGEIFNAAALREYGKVLRVCSLWPYWRHIERVDDVVFLVDASLPPEDNASAENRRLGIVNRYNLHYCCYRFVLINTRWYLDNVSGYGPCSSAADSAAYADAWTKEWAASSESELAEAKGPVPALLEPVAYPGFVSLKYASEYEMTVIVNGQKFCSSQNTLMPQSTNGSMREGNSGLTCMIGGGLESGLKHGKNEVYIMLREIMEHSQAFDSVDVQVEWTRAENKQTVFAWSPEQLPKDGQYIRLTFDFDPKAAAKTTTNE